MNDKILIVEDELITAEDIKEILESQGYTVVDIVDNGLDAFDRASKYSPEIILMDINLKGNMTGTKAAEDIQSHFGIPIIFLTAYADEETLQNAKRANPYGYIIKPYEENDITTAVDLALHKKDTEREQERIFYRELEEVKEQLQSAQGDLTNNTIVVPSSSNESIIAENIAISRKNDMALQDNQDFLLNMLEEIGNYDRFLILDSLREQDRSILELEIILQKAQPTLYHHIRRLEQKGLIRGTKSGKYTTYSLMKNNIQRFISTWQGWTGDFTTWFGMD